ncbi:protein f37c4.5 [Plakobranchus ocellatus]|uniref:Protein f37c4.5 n=1 Tax=Plakobranchus ocellatus TaxID=259542 RepID=A0AAV3ZM30_9GAST|nr:protein f37c4.5 [Plakobranchus ocellatus]
MADKSEIHLMSVKAADCPMTRVTVYKDRAEICRQYEGIVRAGTNELHITHFVDADDDSIRVEGKGNATIAEVCFQTNQKKKDESLPEEEKTLKEELENLEKEYKAGESQYNSQKSMIKKQWTLLDQFAATASGAGQGVSQESLNLTQTYLEGMKNFLQQHREIGQHLEAEQMEMDEKRKELENKIASVKKQLSKLRADREMSYLMKECVLVLEAAEETKMTLSISYIVHNASWTSSYDLRMDTEQGILKIFYYGRISQNSGEDWTKVKLSLSTAEPVVGAAIPILPQTQLSVAAPIRGYNLKAKGKKFAVMQLQSCVDEDVEYRRRSRSAYSNGEMYCDLAAPVALSLPEVQVKEGRTSATYEISGLSTIPSDCNQHKVTVAIIETQPALSYLTVPRIVPHAFLEAKVTNTSPYILLAGPTDIFLDNNCVGKAQLEAAAPNEEFECSLGVDPGVRVTYHPASKSSSSSGVISKSKITVHEQVIEIKNTHPSEVKVKVRENLPKSQDEKIKVNLLIPPINLNKPEKAPKDVCLTKENHIEWDISVPAMKKTEVTLRYSVEHPVDLEVDVTEVMGSQY